MKKRKFNDGGMTEDEVYAKPLAKASFKEAFAEAREAGDKTFEYMGKKYTTEMASDKAKSKSEDKEDPEMVRKAYQKAGEMRKPKVDEAKRQADMVKNEKGVERVAPELDALPVGKIAALGAGTAAALKGMSALGKKAAVQRAEEAAAKKTAERAAKSAAGKQKARASRAKESGAMSDEALSGEFRYKKGGSVSSASKRADGCAIRGKTRA
jgi:hypothetical protein